MESDPVKVGEYLGMAFYVDPELAEGEMEWRDPKTGRVILRVVGIGASPAPETRTTDTCSGCGKSISGPRFCLSCLERVDVTIGAPETRTGEGAAPCGGSRCYLNDDETLWIHSSKSYSSCAVHRQAGDTNLKFTAARAPSPRDGGQP